MSTSSTRFVRGMRDAFFEALYPRFLEDRRLVFITADNGAPTLDRFAGEFPGRYFTVGIAEQQLIGMASGMAFEGRKVYTYAIAPFVTLRCYEQTKLDICAMNLPVVLLGVGAGYAYDIMGPTHHTAEDLAVMRALPGLHIYSPADGVTAAALAGISHETDAPQYIRFDRAGIPDLYQDRRIDFGQGLVQHGDGSDVCLVATGVMVHEALRVVSRLDEAGVRARVIDLFRIKPLNREGILAAIEGCDRIVTLEEHRLPGGLGSLIAELFIDEGLAYPTLRIGQGDSFVFENGGRQSIWEKYGLDAPSVTRRILEWMG